MDFILFSWEFIFEASSQELLQMFKVDISRTCRPLAAYPPLFVWGLHPHGCKVAALPPAIILRRGHAAFRWYYLSVCVNQKPHPVVFTYRSLATTGSHGCSRVWGRLEMWVFSPEHIANHFFGKKRKHGYWGKQQAVSSVGWLCEKG